MSGAPSSILAYYNVTFGSSCVPAQMVIWKGSHHPQHTHKHTFNASAERYRWYGEEAAAFQLRQDACRRPDDTNATRGW